MSENYTDIKKFEAQAPQLMCSIRETTLKIVLKIRHLFKLKNPEYLSLIKQLDSKVPRCHYWFEQQLGQGNVLDLIREGKCVKANSHSGKGKRLVKIAS